MLFLPWKILFFWMLLMGSFITMSASSWFTAWIGLEINMLALLALCLSNKSPRNSEAILKYFLIQALASSILVSSALVTSINSSFFSTLAFPSSILLLSLLLKLGAAPFHFWVSPVSEGLSWMNLSLILTWQKLAPFLLLMLCMNLKDSFLILIICSILSSMFGAIQGMSQSSLRKILAFSSINHMGWMLSSLLIKISSWLVYFSFYSIILSTLIYLAYNLNLNSLTNTSSLHKYARYTLLISLMSLGGLPPLTGFLPKWVIIVNLSELSMILTFFLILSSLITLWFYLRLGIFSLSNKTISVKKIFIPITGIPIILNLSGLLLIPLMI